MARKARKTAKISVRGGFDVLPHNMGTLPRRTTRAGAAATVESSPSVGGEQTTRRVTRKKMYPGVAYQETSPGEVEEEEVVNLGSLARLAAPSDASGPMDADGESSESQPMDMDENFSEDHPKNTQGPEVAEAAADSQYSSVRLEAAGQSSMIGAGGTNDTIGSGALSQDSPLSSFTSPDTSVVFDTSSDAIADTIADTSVDVTEDSTVASATADSTTVTSTTSTTKRRRVTRKSKDNPYGILPTSPFPDYARPTFEECRRVHALLTALHGNADRPASMPTPSLTVAGCGEVPRVLDALVRTMLSGATTMARANGALRKVVEAYGVDDGGSVCWERVAAGTTADLQSTIECAGLSVLKARNIMATLEMVLEGSPDGTLSLDYLHEMATDAAMREMVKFPGVGVKTAACVSLFCLGRPCFAVDTHVLRLSGWLGWLPPVVAKPRASRPKALQDAPGTVSMDDAFFHLDARVPNELKYGLHQLMIRHGQVCVRCQAATAEGTERWDESVCVLEELMGGRVKRKVKVKAGAAVKKEEGEDVFNKEEGGDAVEKKKAAKDEPGGEKSVMAIEEDSVMTESTEVTGMLAKVVKEEAAVGVGKVSQMEIKGEDNESRAEVVYEAVPGTRVTRAMARRGCLV